MRCVASRPTLRPARRRSNGPGSRFRRSGRLCHLESTEEHRAPPDLDERRRHRCRGSQPDRSALRTTPTAQRYLESSRPACRRCREPVCCDHLDESADPRTRRNPQSTYEAKEASRWDPCLRHPTPWVHGFLPVHLHAGGWIIGSARMADLPNGQLPTRFGRSRPSSTARYHYRAAPVLSGLDGGRRLALRSAQIR